MKISSSDIIAGILVLFIGSGIAYQESYPTLYAVAHIILWILTVISFLVFGISYLSLTYFSDFSKLTSISDPTPISIAHITLNVAWGTMLSAIEIYQNWYFLAALQFVLILLVLGLSLKYNNIVYFKRRINYLFKQINKEIEKLDNKQ